jgi:recombination protein RecT
MNMSTTTMTRQPANNGNPMMLPVRSGSELKQLLDTARARLEGLAGGRVPVDRMIQVAASALGRNTALLNCSKLSVLTSVMRAAELGLDCSGALGESYLVPYKGECQLQIGYRGLVTLAHRSGRVRSVEARVVYEGEEFAVDYGTEPKIVHRPDLDAKPNGPLRLVYAVAKLAGGGTQFEVMNKAAVDAVRERSQGRNLDPWKLHYPEMARKTVTRKLCKYLPMSAKDRQAIADDEQREFGGGPAAPAGSADLNALMAAEGTGTDQATTADGVAGANPYDAESGPE